MGDINGRRVVFARDAFNGRQYLDLGRDIQRGGRLIEHNDVRTAGHGHGHHGALQLAAGYLMWIAIPDVFRVRQQQVFIYLDCVLGRLGKGHQAVLDRCFGILLYKPVRGVEGSRRTLGHIGNAPAANGLFNLRRRINQLGAVKDDRAGGDPAALAGVPHGGHADGRFAGSGFPDQSQDFSALQGQINPMDDFEPLFIGKTLNNELLHFK